jgi:hypothetical protein
MNEPLITKLLRLVNGLGEDRVRVYCGYGSGTLMHVNPETLLCLK